MRRRIYLMIDPMFALVFFGTALAGVFAIALFSGCRGCH